MAYQPVFNPDWTDLPSLLILSDAEEEAGNLNPAEVLRWIVREKRIPFYSNTERYSTGQDEVSWDWYCYEHEGRPVNSVVIWRLLKRIRDEDVGNDYRSREWRAFWSLESAYLALINACLDHWEVFLYAQARSVTQETAADAEFEVDRVTRAAILLASLGPPTLPLFYQASLNESINPDADSPTNHS